MHRSKRIAIILPDTLQSIGLHSLLVDYFPPVEVCYFSSYQELSAPCVDAFDYYFTYPELFLLCSDFFMPRRNKTMVLIESASPETLSTSGSFYLCLHASQEVIIEQLQQFLTNDSAQNNVAGEGNKELSVREIDVLQLIVKGGTNKEIADRLNISHNTVLSHRKNITAKLGIKTVSGLTFYAIMNGIVAGDDMEVSG